jgi:hypothetical protein
VTEGLVKFTKADDCPDRDKHYPNPPGFYEQAKELMKTHIQKQCPTCGFWSIWRKRATS